MMDTWRRILAVCAIGALAGCSGRPLTEAEQARLQTAQMPTSQEAAEEAVRRYFEGRLIDPESARYTFRRPVRGSIVAYYRYAGVLMCGTINSRNRMGGYTGRSAFFAYFDPNNPDRVVAGEMDEDRQLTFIHDQCERLYASPGA
jgi:hypothetical protein